VPTNRRRTVRASALSASAREWIRTADADQFFNCKYNPEGPPGYYWPASIKGVFATKPWHCPVYQIWARHLAGEPNCGRNKHTHCSELLQQLIEAHNEWRKHK